MQVVTNFEIGRLIVEHEQSGKRRAEYGKEVLQKGGVFCTQVKGNCMRPWVRDGDIVSIDCGVIKEGFYGDSAFTFPVGEVEEKVLQLLRVTRESLYKGIENAIEGKRIGDIANAVQTHAENAGYSVVRELVGHGVGKHLHESPEVPNYGRKGNGPKLKYGMVIAIEPMVNLGDWRTKILDDGWTVVTKDRKPSAHFEHTIVITKNGPEILTK